MTRALFHPLWIGALLLLVINDHLLKGASLLPGVVTGKLSDFAGLLVAPLVLAALLGVRSRKGFLLAHVGVGLGFAAINLSAAAAGAFEGLMALGPLPWHITVDPTDLGALPMLALSWTVLGRAAFGEGALRAPRWAGRAALAVGLLGCMATSPPPEELFPTVQADLMIANATSSVQVVRIRALKPTVQFDCATVDNLKEPASFFSRQLFDQAKVWVVDPGRAIPVRSGANAYGASAPACHVYLVDGTGMPARLLYWKSVDYPPTEQGTSTSDVHAPATVFLRSPSGGPVTVDPHAAVHVAPPALDPPPPSACEVPDAASGVEWSQRPVGTIQVVAISSSPDGCYAIDYGNLASPNRWYLCVPGVELPFEAGDELTFTGHMIGQNGGLIDGLEMLGTRGRLRVARGRDIVHVGADDISVAVTAASGCGPYHDGCGSLLQAVDIVLSGGSLDGPTEVGESGQLEVTQGTLTIVRALQMEVADTACLPEGVEHGTIIESVFVAEFEPEPETDEGEGE